MPNIKSAKKRVLITKKKNARNRADRSRVNNAIKAFNKAIDTANIEEAERLLPITVSIIDKGVTAGIMHKNAAANKKSAISKRLSDIKSGKVTVVVKKDNKTIAAEKARAAKEAREAARAEFRAKQLEKEAEKVEQKKKKAVKEKAEEKPAKAEKPVKEKAPKKTTKKAEEKPAEAPVEEAPKAE
ncbi:30S ribosomal protein S20 [Anaerocaecibacter muris]|uniref:30S ribosomal protein S20 n=1 Tax=Anaerocaecibacter muris TaxID=2941513 RepID=UPI00203EF115|nr:30S ribosomal protein S20 [Anaerocaecibacter muris]